MLFSIFNNTLKKENLCRSKRAKIPHYKKIFFLLCPLKLLNYYLPLHFQKILADVAKLVDALDLGSSAARHGGSSPSIRTKYEPSVTIKKSRLRVFD